MSLLSRLLGLVADAPSPEPSLPPSPEEAQETGEERVAVAALLLHVARVDGTLAPAERERLVAVLRERFRLTPGAAERLLARGDAADRDVDDVATLVEGLGHDRPLAERRGLLALAYAVAAADGRLHEFEEGWAWRLGRWLGLDDAAIGAIRDEAVPAAARQEA